MPLSVYLGWDSRTAIAYETARASIAHRTRVPISIVPLKLDHLPMLTRPIVRHRLSGEPERLWCPISNAPMSTEFAISRFCVPFLESSRGDSREMDATSRCWALFADCDIICHSDITELFALADDRYAVMTVKHAGASAPNASPVRTKMDGQVQTYYSRKNWSSVVLWNCGHAANKRFTLDSLNTWPGRDLHAFKWLDDSEIGELPQHWNWLINVTAGEPQPHGIWHYTLGGPWFDGWKPARHDEVWRQESNLLCAAIT